MANPILKIMNLLGIETEDEGDALQQDQPPRRGEREDTRQDGPRPYSQTAQTYEKTAQSQKKGGRVVAHPSYDPNLKHQTSIYQIREHTETRVVIDDLLAGKSVLLNLENMDQTESQRVIDTLSGAAYAIEATLKKAAHQTYYIAPINVEIGGNYAEEPRRAAGGIFGAKGRNEI